MSSARTYDAALPLPFVFVAKMKSVKDCLNMAETSIPNCRLKRGKIRVKNQSLHEDSAHACAESHDPEFHASKGSYGGTPDHFTARRDASPHQRGRAAIRSSPKLACLSVIVEKTLSFRIVF